MAKEPKSQRYMWSKVFTYDEWMESIGLPVHKGFYIEDVRTLELEWWEERQCKAAFIQLMGQEGVSSARVTEIPPGKTLPPIKFALDELVYVADGRGLTTVWHFVLGGVFAPGSRASSSTLGLTVLEWPVRCLW